MKHLYGFISLIAVATLADQYPSLAELMQKPEEEACVTAQDQLDAYVHELLAELKTLVIPSAEPLLDLTEPTEPIGELMGLLKKMTYVQELIDRLSPEGAAIINWPLHWSERVLFLGGGPAYLLGRLYMGLGYAAEWEWELRTFEGQERLIDIRTEAPERFEKRIKMMRDVLPYVSSCIKDRIQVLIGALEKFQARPGYVRDERGLWEQVGDILNSAME